MKKLALFLLLGCAFSVQAQLRNDDVHKLPEMRRNLTRTPIRIPDVNGYQTLKCDFHTHTVFSDGNVWPNMRVQEAWQEGLDAIAITDHIEYLPHKDQIKSDLNESYKIAKKEGDDIGFIVIKGSEITRSKPLGHLNALFIQDSEKLNVDDPLQAIDEAVNQGAFIMWNHPGWPDNKSTMYPVHEELINAGKINGYEVFNHMESYPLTFDWYSDKNLAPMANTDIHGLTANDYFLNDGLRPMTLVFADNKSEKGIRDALFAGRSLALFNNTLVGNPDLLTALVKASLQVVPVTDKKSEVTNLSDIPFTLTANGEMYIFPAGKTVRISTPEPDTQFVVENCLTGKDKPLQIMATAFNY